MKKYHINHKVVFEPATRRIYLTNDTAKTATLSVASSRCLHALIKHEGLPLSKDSLLQYAWRQHGVMVTDNSVHQAITAVRKNLRDIGFEENIITTIPRVGYQLNATVVDFDIDINKSSFNREAVLNGRDVFKNFFKNLRKLKKFRMLILLFISNVIIWSMITSFKDHKNKFLLDFFLISQMPGYKELNTSVFNRKLFLSVDLLNKGHLVKVHLNNLAGNKEIQQILNNNNNITHIYVNGTYKDNVSSFFLCSGDIRLKNTHCKSFIQFRG